MRDERPEDKQGSGTSPNRGSSLHTKLQTILKRNNGPLATQDELNTDVAQILQAFESEGYIKHPVGVDPLHSPYDHRLMTGKEFLDRFKAELANQNWADKANDLDNAMRAARRASGVSE